MSAHILRVTFQAEFALGVVFGFGCGEIGIQRCLDVDNQLSLVRHVHDHVGANDLVVIGRVYLFDEIAVLDHAGQFDQPAQRDFPPLTAHFRTAQRFDEILRFLRQRFLAELHCFQLVPDTAVGLAARFFEIRNLFL